MEQFLIFTDRNLKLYFRDRATVFFSLLSMIITIALMVFFLGNMNIDVITDLLGQFPNRDYVEDEKNARLLIYSWTSAGIISMNAVTVTLAVYSTMIKDRMSGKLNSIYTAPVSRTIITVSYIATAWIAATIVCVFTLAVTEMYGIIQGLEVYSIAQHIHILGIICMNSFVYATFMYLLALIAKSEGAWSGIGTLVGTLVGFLGAIYIPIGSLSDSIQSLLKCTPIIYSTALFRKIMLESILKHTFDGIPKNVTRQYREAMGIDITIFDHSVSGFEIGIVLLFIGIAFVGIDVSILKYSKKVDR